MNFPENIKYTKNHEWIRVDGNTAYIGITAYAQHELGDIVFVEVETEGETLKKGDVFGTIEAVKTVSDVYMPVSGTVFEFNPNLADEPELINQSPYENGWIIKIELKDFSEVETLLSVEDYKAQIEA